MKSNKTANSLENSLENKKIIISDELHLEFYLKEILDVLNKQHSWAGSLHHLIGNDRFRLKEDIIKWLWRELSWEQLNEIQNSLSARLQYSEKNRNEILLFNSLIENELARRNEVINRYLDLFRQIPFKEIKKTNIFQKLTSQIDLLKNPDISDELLQHSFFEQLKKYMIMGNANLREFENLLIDVDKVLFHLADRDNKAVDDALMMMILYERLLADSECPKPVGKFLGKLEDHLQKMRDGADKFQQELLPLFTIKSDKISFMCDLINGQLFKNYCDAISKVTGLYYNFLFHWDAIHSHFPTLQMDQASPLKFIGLIPYHKKELELLKDNNPPRDDLKLALSNVKTILSRWFNH